MQNLPLIAIDDSELVVFGALTMAMVSIWFPSHMRHRHYANAAILFFLLALILALHYQYVELIAIPIILIFAWGLILARHQKPWPQSLGVGLVFLLSISFMRHIIPGFHNPALIKDAIISQNGVPYSLYLNFDKALVGFFFLLLGTSVIRSGQELKNSLKLCLIAMPLIVALVMMISIALGYIHLDLKYGYFFFQWAWINLFFTCLAEECFFRGFVQNRLARLFSHHRDGSTLALTIASCLFGIAHMKGGFKYVILATIAGMGYGWIYQRTRHIEAAVITHFSVNVVHFLCFTYPALS